MAFTAQNVIDLAGERSNLNDTSLISEAQLLDYIESYQRRIYLLGARENPDYFGREGNTASRSAGASWDLTSTPGNVAAVSRLEIQSITGSPSGLSTGDEVNVVSIRNPDDALAPRVYLRDRKVFEYSDELNDDSSNFVDTLKVFYSYLPGNITATSTSLDIPEEWVALVYLPLAATMALRDQRENEAAVINQEFQLELSNFVNQVTVFDEVTTRELEQAPASFRLRAAQAAQRGGGS